MLVSILLFSSGCVTMPDLHGKKIDQPTPSPSNLSNESLPVLQVSEKPTSQQKTPSPIQNRSNITDWNPYQVIPTPTPVLNHTSILKNTATPEYRKILNTTYSGSVGLNGNAIGKDLNITTGPFSVTYTVHPNISSPLNVWAKITIFDPWQNVIAVGGYNRGYPDQETQTITQYREGRYYLTIEGDFAKLDYTIKTGDIVPVITQTPVPASMDDEELMRMLQG